MAPLIPWFQGVMVTRVPGRPDILVRKRPLSPMFRVTLTLNGPMLSSVLANRVAGESIQACSKRCQGRNDARCQGYRGTESSSDSHHHGFKEEQVSRNHDERDRWVSGSARSRMNQGIMLKAQPWDQGSLESCLMSRSRFLVG